MEPFPFFAKAAAYLALALCAGIAFHDFRQSAAKENAAQSRLSVETAPGEPTEADAAEFRTLKYIGLFLSAAVALALLFAWDFCAFFADRAMNALFEMNDRPSSPSPFDEARALREQGLSLPAIERLREHLHAQRRDVHAAVMIAEIYERDLGNPLTAALEYEEMLTWRMNRERWSRLAVRLVNLYAKKLRRSDRAWEILREIVRKAPRTRAADAARKRLALRDVVLKATPDPSVATSGVA